MVAALEISSFFSVICFQREEFESGLSFSRIDLSMSALKGWRRAYGALKDTTTLSLATVNSNFKVVTSQIYQVFVKNPSLTRCVCGVDLLCLESRTWTSPLSRPPATSNARPRSDTFKVRSINHFPLYYLSFDFFFKRKDFDRVQGYVLFFLSRVFCFCFGEFAADRCGLLRAHTFQEIGKDT